jgi:hypothetical protein
VPWPRRLVARPPTAEARVRARVSPCGIFVVDKVALGQVFQRVLRFSLVRIIIPSAFHTLISTSGEEQQVRWQPQFGDSLTISAKKESSLSLRHGVSTDCRRRVQPLDLRREDRSMLNKRNSCGQPKWGGLAACDWRLTVSKCQKLDWMFDLL